MHAALALIVAMAGAFQTWVEPPLTRVFPNTERGKSSLKEIRLHAACGERESVQICFRADKKAGEKISVEGSAMDPEIPAPEIRRVGYLNVSTDPDRTEIWPDPLLDYAPVEVPAGETRAVWVTYSVPHDAVPRTYKGRITIRPEKGPKKRIPVTLVVYRFAIPEVPSLRSLFPLNRQSVIAMYDISDDNLNAWKPIYDAFSGNRISYSVWNAGTDVSRKQEHIAYAVESAKMNTIDIGVPKLPDPPFKEHVSAMNEWLVSKGWLSRAVIEPCTFAERAKWPAIRHDLFRMKEMDPRVTRLFAGPFHPFFEEYLEIAAVPLRAFDPQAATRFSQGFSLIDAPVYSVSSVTASSTESDSKDAATSLVAASLPEDACDGSLFTAWVSKESPSRANPQWLEIKLRHLIRTQHLKIIWRNGLEATDFSVAVKRNEAFVSLRDAEWKPYPPVVPYGQSWAETELKRPITFSAIRFTFQRSAADGPIGVTEVVLADSTHDTPTKIPVIENWLLLEQGRFPSLTVDAHPLEARLTPWVCFGQIAAGFLYRALNNWPDSWKDAAQIQPLIWADPKRARDYLFYPGRDRPIPSIRSELLREGMEDYEYLVALESVAVKGRVKDPEILQWAGRYPYPAALPGESLDKLAGQLGEKRAKIGWLLDDLAGKETK